MRRQGKTMWRMGSSLHGSDASSHTDIISAWEKKHPVSRSWLSRRNRIDAGMSHDTCPPAKTWPFPEHLITLPDMLVEELPKRVTTL